MPRAVLALLTSITLVGCAVTPGEDDRTASSSARLTELSPVGTFRAGELSPGVYESITFLANGTYRASAVGRCLSEDCATRTVVAIEGTWTSDDTRATQGGLSTRLTLRPIDGRPAFDALGNGAYIGGHEIGHAALNLLDEYAEPGLEADRLPTPGVPVRGGPTYPLQHLGGGCTSDDACANTVCEQGSPQCTAFGTCGCVVPVIVEAN